MADNPITVQLPQDLPTNWTYGQTIGPNGTDVGLTQQHGYNYLMKQVNAAQKAAEELGEAFTDVPTAGEYELPLEDAPQKSSIANADAVAITDSAAGNATKRVLWSTITSALSQLFAPISHNHAASQITSGILSVARGGTGKASFTANGLIYASFATTLASVSGPSSNNSILTCGPNRAPSWASPQLIASILGLANVVTGSYTGSGQGGESYPTSLEFESPPKVIFISKAFESSSSSSSYDGDSAIIIPTASYGIFYNASNGTMGGYPLKITSRTATVSWYVSNTGANPRFQLNETTKYTYVALLLPEGR